MADVLDSKSGVERRVGSTPTIPTLTDEDRKFLEALSLEIWERHFNPHAYNGQIASWSTEKRRLTEDELARVVDIAIRNPCEIHNASMANIGLYVYEAPDDPPYPGVTRDKPKGLFSITSKHLPGVPDVGRDHFAKGWQVFSAIALRSGNVAWCKEYGLELAVNRREVYDY